MNPQLPGAQRPRSPGSPSPFDAYVQLGRPPSHQPHPSSFLGGRLPYQVRGQHAWAEQRLGHYFSMVGGDPGSEAQGHKHQQHYCWSQSQQQPLLWPAAGAGRCSVLTGLPPASQMQQAAAGAGVTPGPKQRPLASGVGSGCGALAARMKHCNSIPGSPLKYNALSPSLGVRALLVTPGKFPSQG